MANWVKTLVWALMGLGGGSMLGFAIGRRKGYVEGAQNVIDTLENSYNEGYDQGFDEGKAAADLVMSAQLSALRNSISSMNYDGSQPERGDIPSGDYDGDNVKVERYPVGRVESFADSDEDMVLYSDGSMEHRYPEKIPSDPETFLSALTITESEYRHNEWGYDTEDLVFYEHDEVLAKENGDIVEDPDSVLGIGALMNLGGDPNDPSEELFVRNDILGTLFHVELYHEAYRDVYRQVDGDE